MGCKAIPATPSDNQRMPQAPLELTDKVTKSDAYHRNGLCYMYILSQSFDSKGREDIDSKTVSIAIDGQTDVSGPCTPESIANGNSVSFTSIPELKWLKNEPALFHAMEWVTFLAKASDSFPEACLKATHGQELSGVTLSSFTVTDVLFLRSESTFTFFMTYRSDAKRTDGHDWLLEVRVPSGDPKRTKISGEMIKQTACNIDFGE